MIDIIQLYTSMELFTKVTYTPENRAAFNTLPPTINSTNGYLDSDVLILPSAYRDHPDIKSAEVIVIQDTNGRPALSVDNPYEGLDLPEWFKRSRSHFLKEETNRLFALRQLSSPKSFEFFKIGRNDSNCYELYIDYLSNSMKIGTPERENHKICELKPSQPIRYTINGKSDFTLTGRKERTYYEYDYVIEWVGTAKTITYRDLNTIGIQKKLPGATYKLIDERKRLY